SHDGEVQFAADELHLLGALSPAPVGQAVGEAGIGDARADDHHHRAPLAADARARLAVGETVEPRALLRAQVVDIIAIVACGWIVDELIEREARQYECHLVCPVLPLDCLAYGPSCAHL